MVQRTRLARGFGAVLVAILIGTTALGAWARFWSSDKYLHQLAAVGVVFTVGTFVLATVAGIVHCSPTSRRSSHLTSM